MRPISRRRVPFRGPVPTSHDIDMPTPAHGPTDAATTYAGFEIGIGVSRKLPRATQGVLADIPERLILSRWKRLGPQLKDGWTYDGCRLPPSLWRLTAAALEREPGLLALPADRVKAVVAAIRTEKRAMDVRWGSVRADALLVLLNFLQRRRRLAAILKAHRDQTRFGVPDLALYRIRHDGRVDLRLVEVKMPRERLRADQVEELKMLVGFGLTAGVVRLRARATPPAPTARTVRRTNRSRKMIVG